ncbi:MAG: hypothetical protein ACXAC7_02960 [Candidatus Hodarchaeales archaeon]|jgi:hypothetical protein
MSLHQPDYYHLVPIKELPNMKINQKIQLIGQISEFSPKDNRTVIDDTTGHCTIFLELELKEGDCVRVFGVWDGIQVKASHGMRWDIPADKIPLLLRPTK